MKTSHARGGLGGGGGAGVFAGTKLGFAIIVATNSDDCGREILAQGKGGFFEIRAIERSGHGPAGGLVNARGRREALRYQNHWSARWVAQREPKISGFAASQKKLVGAGIGLLRQDSLQVP